MTTATEEMDQMTKSSQKTVPVRVSEEAIKWARIASGYTGESVSEYLSRIAIERGQQDADQLHAKVRGDKPPKR